MINLEHSQPVEQITTPVGKRIQTGAQDHVLANTVRHPRLDDVLPPASPHANPARERKQLRHRQLRPKPGSQRNTLLTPQPFRQVIVQHPRPRLLTMQPPRNSGHPRRTTRPAPRSTHNGAIVTTDHVSPIRRRHTLLALARGTEMRQSPLRMHLHKDRLVRPWKWPSAPAPLAS